MKVRNLTFAYGKKGSRPILRGLSFSLPVRGLFAIYGPSGSGKSTLLSILAGNLAPSGGHLEVDGVSLERLSRGRREDFRLRQVGFLPQSFHLLEDRSVLHNASLPLRMLGVPKRAAEETAIAHLQAVGLGDSAAKKAALLSGGEKARLAFVRALVKDPPLLLADEPTGNLDGKSAQILMDLLREESRKRLVIIVSHDEELARSYIDGFLRLRDGRIVESSLPAADEEGSRPLQKGRGLSYLAGSFFRSFVDDRGKLALTFLASAVASSLILFSLAFVSGAEAAVKEESRLSLSYLSLSYSVIEKGSEVGLLTLSKARRPSLAERELLRSRFEGIEVVPDLSYYFPSSCPISVNGFPKEEVSLVPVASFSYLADPSWNGRFEGEAPSGSPLDYCVVNRAFEEWLGEEALGKTVAVKRDIHLESDDLTEDFSIGFSFVVASVVDEFAFMEVPRVYYSYQALAGYLKNVSFLSLAGNPYSYVEEARDDSPLSSYRCLVYAQDAGTVEEMVNSEPLFEGFSLSSEAVMAASSLADLSRAFLLLIEPFLVLVSGAAFFLLFGLSYASFLARRREFAIYLLLGAKESDLLLLASLPAAIASSLGALAAVALSPLLLELGRSYFLSRAGLPLLSPAVAPLSGAIMVAAFFFLALLGCLLPLLRGSFRNLHEELAEE